jgi:hypothetical protein
VADAEVLNIILIGRLYILKKGEKTIFHDIFFSSEVVPKVEISRTLLNYTGLPLNFLQK